jgi:hypothetical protein
LGGEGWSWYERIAPLSCQEEGAHVVLKDEAALVFRQSHGVDPRRLSRLARIRTTSPQPSYWGLLTCAQGTDYGPEGLLGSLLQASFRKRAYCRILIY